MVERSAGGVVIHENKALLLKKVSGLWVLPKGHIEEGENSNQAAIREVLEETGLECKIKSPLGNIFYTFNKNNGFKVKKTVDFYWMMPFGGDLSPQKEEGFVSAKFIECEKALTMLAHKGERDMLSKAIKYLKNEDKSKCLSHKL